MLNWIKDAYNSVFGKIDNSIASWVRGLVTGLWHYLASIFSPVSKAWHEFATGIGRLETLLTGYGASVVLRFQDIYAWINKEGHIVYYYISHPDKLATLVIDGVIAQLEADTMANAEKLGKFFLSLIMKHLPALLKVIEDILDAVL
jgi:hypothetical protein